MNEDNEVTPLGESGSPNGIPEKKFSEPTATPPLTKGRKRSTTLNERKKNPNFPKKGKRGARPAKILDSHREVFKLYKEQGFRNLGKAVRRTGVYSEGVADRVNVITKSKSWQLLMQEYLPESTIAIRHAELLDKRDWRKVESGEVDAKGNKIMMEVDNGPETLAVSKGLELAYRLRGAFQKEEAPPASTVMYNLFYKPEVRDQIKAFEDGLKTSLLNEINKRNTKDDEDEESPGDGGRDSSVKEGISGSKNL